MNYDPSKVGVPYVRAHRIVIDYPDGGRTPTATIEQSLAVKLADGTVRKLEDVPQIDATLNFANGNNPIPLVDPETALPTGSTTTLNQVFLGMLAVVRAEQVEHNP